MGQRSDGRASSVVGYLDRYRRVAFALLFAAVMLTGSVAGAVVLDGGGSPAAESGQSNGGTHAGVTTIDSCTVIDEPGTYRLTDDVEGAAANACLHIKSDDVVLEGNGHTVAGNGTDSGVGILVFNGSRTGFPREGPGLSNVTVRDVTVSDWKRGVQAGATQDEGPTVTLQNVTATNDGRGVSLYWAGESRLSDVTVVDNERAGLALWGTTNATAEGVTASNNGASGISFTNAVVGSTFSNLTVRNNAGHGIHVSTGARNNTVTGARVANNEGAGVAFIDSTGNLVSDSTVVDNAGPGILADPSDGDRLRNVRVSGNAIAYRNGFSGVRYGAIANGLRLDTGVVASFEQNVSSFDGAREVSEPPRDARVVGPAANLSMSEDAPPQAAATITFPYADEAVGNESTLGVFRYSDGTWRPVAETSVDARNQTVTATVRESGIVVPVYADQCGSVSAKQSTFVVNATGDGSPEVTYGLVVEGAVETASGAALPSEAEEELIAERDDGTTVVIGTTGEDGGDTFLVTGEIVRFATDPTDASVALELDGEEVTDRLSAGE